MARSGPQPLEQEGAMQELGKAEYDADIDSSFSAHPSVVDRYFTRTYKPGRQVAKWDKTIVTMSINTYVCHQDFFF